MVKPISEHKTTVKAQKRAQPNRESSLHPVEGGSVRRIVFEEEPEFEEVHEETREWTPRSDDSIDDIHFEIDNMDRFGARRDAVRSDRVETRTVYRTGGGRVREAHQETESGKSRRVLYTTRRKGSVEEERRFNSTSVDRVIAGADTPVLEETQPKKGKATKAKKAKASKAKTTQKAIATKAKTTKTVTRRRTVKKAGKTVVTQSVDDGTIQPQCMAVTSAGKQCRNSSKGGSTYCGAHQGFTSSKAMQALDTKPTKKVEDTKPGQKGSSKTAQCAAYTQAGLQCSRASRTTSKYCGLHKSYRAPSKTQLADRVRTKPRVKKAKDTKPKL